MKPRTVIVTLELRDCTIPLAVLRDNYNWNEAVLCCCSEIGEDATVAQVTVTVAQPSKDKK